MSGHRTIAVAALAAAAAACSPSDDPVVAATPAEVMEALSLRSAQPAISAMASEARAMQAAVARLCEQPDADRLGDARDAWRTAYIAWRRAGPFLFGPGDDLALDRRLGSWPANAVVIDALVRDPTLAESNYDPAARGYAGVEYLLYAPDDAAAATRDDRCGYLSRVSGEMIALTGRVEQQWLGEYGAGVSASGSMEAAGPPLSRALAHILNQTENLLWQRVGLPSSFFREDANSERLEAWRSAASRDGLAASVAGLSQLMDGQAGQPGVTALIAAKDPALAADIRQHLRLANADLDAIDQPLREALIEDGDSLKPLYQHMQELQNLIADAAEVLALNVDFQEDGD